MKRFVLVPYLNGAFWHCQSCLPAAVTVMKVVSYFIFKLNEEEKNVNFQVVNRILFLSFLSSLLCFLLFLDRS